MGRGGVEGAVGTLVGPAHLAHAQRVQRRHVEGRHEEALRPEGLDDDGLPRSGQVGHRKVSESAV